MRETVLSSPVGEPQRRKAKLVGVRGFAPKETNNQQILRCLTLRAHFLNKHGWLDMKYLCVCGHVKFWK